MTTRRPSPPARFALAALWLSLGAARSGAQISPGPLAAPHAALEGNRACLSCHRAGKGVDSALCLDCHRALGGRVRAGLGPHARADHQRCERCHSEHNGREFALVRWEVGERSFDHAESGWRLEGKHARAACRDCHRPERIAPALRATEPGIDLARTYLGLERACSTCHADPHQGSLAPAACTDCHGQETWKGASGFDHARTRYPLVGAHAKTPCLDCHKQPGQAQAGAAASLLLAQFKDRPIPDCAACHADVHKGRLGADCATCHSTSTFRAAEVRRVDHDRTAYPLRGRHRTVACERCHTPGRELRIPGFARCETCHADGHAGQLATVAAGKTVSACADCHDVAGFEPARFGPDEHARSRYPLEGAHLAVPCVACHREVAAASLPSGSRRPASGRTRQYRFAGTTCRDCHRDPHRGALDRFAGAQGCATCHDASSWRTVAIEHDQTRFPLVGKHAGVACAACHPRDGAGQLALVERPLDCAGCHRDVHAGQLAVAGATRCERCHDANAFRPAPGFVHARDSRYALDGKHETVACAACHPVERLGGENVVRFKPLPVACAGCHASAGRSRSTG